MIHDMQWSRPESSHSGHNLDKMMGKGTAAAKVMYRCMEHYVGALDCGVTLLTTKAEMGWYQGRGSIYFSRENVPKSDMLPPVTYFGDF